MVRFYIAVFKISTHSPRVGRDLICIYSLPFMLLFQPTLPVWGETKVPPLTKYFALFQPTLPVWGETA